MNEFVTPNVVFKNYTDGSSWEHSITPRGWIPLVHKAKPDHWDVYENDAGSTVNYHFKIPDTSGPRKFVGIENEKDPQSMLKIKSGENYAER